MGTDGFYVDWGIATKVIEGALYCRWSGNGIKTVEAGCNVALGIPRMRLPRWGSLTVRR